MTLLIATAAATGYWGLTHFWKDASPDAVALIESGISDGRYGLDDATFVVREAVFDGKNLAGGADDSGDGWTRCCFGNHRNEGVSDNCSSGRWLGAIENQKGLQAV